MHQVESTRVDADADADAVVQNLAKPLWPRRLLVLYSGKARLLPLALQNSGEDKDGDWRLPLSEGLGWYLGVALRG